MHAAADSTTPERNAPNDAMTTIEDIKTELREIIDRGEKLNANWVVKSQQRELGQSGEYETETYIEDVRGFCVVNGWNLEERDEENFAFIAASRNLSPKMAKALLGLIEWLELYAIPTSEAQNQLETIRREWEVQV